MTNIKKEYEKKQTRTSGRKFNGEKFIMATKKAVEIYGSIEEVEKNLNAFTSINDCKEKLDYANRIYAKDFKIVKAIINGESAGIVDESVYDGVTAEVEKLFTKKPFSMQKFVEHMRKNMGISVMELFSKKYIRQDDNRYGYERDIKTDYTYVLDALRGYNAPAYITDALTDEVYDQLYSIGFGESVPFNLERFLAACEDYNSLKTSVNLQDFDIATSEMRLGYHRSFARDCAYIHEILNNEENVSEVVAEYKQDRYLERIKKAKIPNFEQTKVNQEERSR